MRRVGLPEESELANEFNISPTDSHSDNELPWYTVSYSDNCELVTRADEIKSILLKNLLFSKL